jgi:hypothetical protein
MQLHAGGLQLADLSYLSHQNAVKPRGIDLRAREISVLDEIGPKLLQVRNLKV